MFMVSKMKSVEEVSSQMRSAQWWSVWSEKLKDKLKVED